MRTYTGLLSDLRDALDALEHAGGAEIILEDCEQELRDTEPLTERDVTPRTHEH